MISVNSNKYKQILDAVDYFVNNKEISIRKCALKFNIHRETLANKLKELDLHENRRSYSFDDMFFNSIDNENKAYWLGFILADGCLKSKINQLSLRISNSDKEHLLKFKQVLKSNHPISVENTILRNKEYKIATFKIQNKKLYNDLLNLGIEPNKSKTEKCYTLIQKELLNHYIRGIFDGDGWFYQNTNCCEIGFGMGKEALEFIKNTLEIHANVRKYDIKEFHNIYRYRITSKKEIKKVFNYLYNDAQIYLDRKYESYKIAVLDSNI